ncbi:MAG: hypothetical protein IJZ64_08065 [Ruminococcus sp.]|nr:hypothetical protein [Ruminococcus sp.]
MIIKNILNQIAMENNISLEEVRKEITYAIEEAMRSDDPIAKNLWSQISKNGETPTPEETIEFICSLIINNQEEDDLLK